MAIETRSPVESRLKSQEDSRADTQDLLPAVKGSLSGLRNRLSTQLSRWEDLLTCRYRATYGIAVTRILLGLTGLGLLLTNFRSRHYTFGVGSAWNGEIEEPVSHFPRMFLFSMFHQVVATPWFFTLLYVGLAFMAILIVLGWRTRVVMPLYLVYWVSFIEINDAVGDQGDNAYRIFLLAMVFTHSSLRWSLDARRERLPSRGRSEDESAARDAGGHWALVTVHNLALVVLAFQVCAIYVAGGLYKAGGDPWAQGYAIYDPLQTAQFGTWPVLSDLLTVWGPAVVLMTWGSMLFQIAFPFLLFNRYTKIVALLGILSFHLAIGLLMGLPWFSLTMIAVDAIFIRDHSYRRLVRRLGSITAERSRVESGRTTEAELQVDAVRHQNERISAVAGSR